jgi:hypothetical protein
MAQQTQHSLCSHSSTLSIQRLNILYIYLETDKMERGRLSVKISFKAFKLRVWVGELKWRLWLNKASFTFKADFPAYAPIRDKYYNVLEHVSTIQESHTSKHFKHSVHTSTGFWTRRHVSITLYYLPLNGAWARESALKADALLTHNLHFNWQTQTLNLKTLKI